MRKIVSLNLIFVLLLSLIPISFAQITGSCVNAAGVSYCGGKNPTSNCHCDSSCEDFGDCCVADGYENPLGYVMSVCGSGVASRTVAPDFCDSDECQDPCRLLDCQFGCKNGVCLNPSDSIDTLQYFLSNNPDKSLTGSHPMNFMQAGNKVYYTKWAKDSFEVYTWDDQYIYLKEDHSGSPHPDDYTFSPGKWMKRWMKIGEVVDNSNNVLQYFDPINCNPKNSGSFPYKIFLEDHIPNYNLEGDLGIQDVIVIKYDYSTPGNNAYEKSYYSKEWGFVKWESYEDGKIVHSSIFNKISKNVLKPDLSLSCLKNSDYCGDGVCQTSEKTCLTACPGCAAGTPPELCQCTEICDTSCPKDCPIVNCGNGIIDAGEQCDDGNNKNGDGCDSKCIIEVSDFSYKTNVLFGRGDLQKFGVNFFENEDDVLNNFLIIEKDKPFLEWTIDFSYPSNIDSLYLLNKNIKLFGDNYLITSAGASFVSTTPKSAEFIMMKDGLKSSLREGETKTYSLNGVDYDVTLSFADTTSNNFKLFINGEFTDDLRLGDSNTLRNGAIIKLGGYSELNGKFEKLDFYIGHNLVEFRDSTLQSKSVDGSVTINNENIEDAKVGVEVERINGLFQIKSITYQLEADANRGSTVYVQAGEYLSQHLNEPEGLLGLDFYLYGALESFVHTLDLYQEGSDIEVKIKDGNAFVLEKYDLISISQGKLEAPSEFRNAEPKEFNIPYYGYFELVEDTPEQVKINLVNEKTFGNVEKLGLTFTPNGDRINIEIFERDYQGKFTKKLGESGFAEYNEFKIKGDENNNDLETGRTEYGSYILLGETPSVTISYPQEQVKFVTEVYEGCKDQSCKTKKIESYMRQPLVANIVSKPPQRKCTDTDGGKDFFTKGTASDGQFTLTDECRYTFSSGAGITRLMEYYCHNGKVSEFAKVCVDGCSNGACNRNLDLSNYPDFFDDVVIVVGEKGSSSDITVAKRIAKSLSHKNVKIKIDKDIGSLNAWKGAIISVGSGCASLTTFEIEGYPDNCAKGMNVNEGYINLFQHNGYPRIVVKGYSDVELKAAANALINYKISNMKGKSHVVTIKDTVNGDCDGCYVDGRCVPVGFRKNPDYCDFDVGMTSQKTDRINCVNSFECVSNICADSQCVKAGLLRRFIAQLDRDSPGDQDVDPVDQDPIPSDPIEPEPVACTADVKTCPDGSTVSRVAPSCEFAECPIVERPRTAGRLSRWAASFFGFFR